MLSPVTGRDSFLRILGALAEPTRLHLLEVLLFHGGPRSGPVAAGEPGMCLSDLELLVGQPHSLVSFHLRTLRAAGVVSVERRGRWSLYQVVPGALETVVAVLTQAVREARAKESRAGLRLRAAGLSASPGS